MLYNIDNGLYHSEKQEYTYQHQSHEMQTMKTVEHNPKFTLYVYSLNNIALDLEYLLSQNIK